jgi:hypothetical protein
MTIEKMVAVGFLPLRASTITLEPTFDAGQIFSQ